MKPKRRFVPGFQICWGFRVMANSALPTGFSQKIINLVAQDARQPGALRRLAGKGLSRFDRGQKSLLDNVLSYTRVAHLANGEVEKIIGMGFHPIATKSRVAL